jgi:crotonobetainyl-CoA:carnitine CoA-transferase CaiB-like acyl-CoA transferase
LTRPLEGLRVLDLTIFIAGPAATRVLAHLGAEVIKIEAPWGRSASTEHTNDSRPYNAIPSFNEVNRAKLSISLDLQTYEGREVLKRLVEISDVLVQNFSPRVMPNLGLDYETLHSLRPDLISVSMPALGITGPWADYVSFGPGAEALGGLSDVTGYEGGPPHKPANFYADQNSAFHTALAVMAAAYQRRRTGRGQQLSVVQRETTMAVIGEAFLEAQMGSQIPLRRGNHHTFLAPHNVYRCRGDDEWCAIACTNDEQFQRLCATIDQPRLASDPRFADGISRKNNEAALDIIVENWTEERSHYRVMYELQAAGVPAGAALKPTELLTDPHWEARHFLHTVHHPEARPVPQPGLPWKASRSSNALQGRAPLFGEHNRYVREELLALPADLLWALKDKNVMPDEPI